MHVVFAIDHLQGGGSQRQAVELAVWLRRDADLRVSFLIYRGDEFYAERLREAGIPVASIPKRSKYDPRLPWRLRRWLRENPAAVVHAFLPWPSLWCWLAVRSLPRGERPLFIAAERSSLVATTLRETLMQRLVYRGSDAITVNAESIREEIHRKLGVARERIHYIPNGIDLPGWDRAASAPCPLPLAPGRFHLALIGGLRREKNHQLVLSALERLGRERIRDWRVWFIGAESGGRGVARGIRAAIERLDLGEIVRVQPQISGIAAVMRRLDGVLLPSAFEGFPNVALEAMASRVPVIASRVGDLPNMIEDGVTGYLLPRIDAGALADAMARLHALPRAERDLLGSRARECVEARYAMPALAGRTLALYREVTVLRAAKG